MKKTIFFKLICLFTGFWVGNLTAQVDFDPDYETQKIRVSYVPGIKVTRGATKVLVPEHESYCPMPGVFRFNNGDIQVNNRRSKDGGKTWDIVEHTLSGSTYQFPEPDGEVLAFVGGVDNRLTGGENENAVRGTNQEGVLEGTIARSKDSGVSWSHEKIKIFLPEKSVDWNVALNRKIVRSEDGSLLMNMWYRSKGDYNRGVFVVRSTDRGRTWHYLSTIAFDLFKGIRSEGFNETDLLVLPDGKILSFMRTGVSYQGSMGSHNNNDPSAEMPFSYNPSTPIYMSKSLDHGKTWSNADPITEEFGVWPGSVLLENGIIAVNYGRPGNWIMFSKDEGKSWGPIIPFYHGLYPPDCSNYFTMVEVEPNLLFVVYARTNPNDHTRSEIVGTYFKVERTAAE